MPATLLAVDTNFLLDLAYPKDVAHDALEVIRQRLRGAQLFVTSRVLNELAHKSQNDPDLEVRADARATLLRMRSEWGMQPVELSDLQAVTAGNVARTLLEQGIIEREEQNDARIVAEAAVLGCQLLVSSDSDLCDANQGKLALALQACGVSVVLVFSPAKLVREFAGRR